MVYYTPSRSYQIIGNTHANIVRHAASVIRAATVVIDNQRIWDFTKEGPLSDTNFPNDKKVILLSGEEHVLTINKQFPRAEISQEYENIAIDCATSGWLEVKL